MRGCNKPVTRLVACKQGLLQACWDARLVTGLLNKAVTSLVTASHDARLVTASHLARLVTGLLNKAVTSLVTASHRARLVTGLLEAC